MILMKEDCLTTLRMVMVLDEAGDAVAAVVVVVEDVAAVAMVAMATAWIAVAALVLPLITQCYSRLDPHADRW